MPSLSLETKELKGLLKTLSLFSAQSLRKSPVVTLAFDQRDPDQKDPAFQLIMNTDHAFIAARPKTVTDWDGQSQAYSFNPETLLGLALSGKQVQIGWAGEKSPLQLKDNKFSTSLKVAVPQPTWDHVPPSLESFEVPIEILGALTHYLSVPFSYFKSKTELMPVHFKRNKDGKLIAMADDSYSLALVETNIQVPFDLDIKVPKYVLDSLYGAIQFRGSTSSTMVKFGVKGFSVSLQNHEVQVFTSGLNDETADFDTTFAGLEPWKASCKFSPKLLRDAIKPLLSLIPSKERTGTIIEMELTKEKMSLAMRQKDIGEAKVEAVDGVSEIVNESAAPRVLVHMHPQAFSDYTDLFDVDEAQLFASSGTVYYKGSINSGTGPISIRYLFPTVQV